MFSFLIHSVSLTEIRRRALNTPDNPVLGSKAVTRVRSIFILSPFICRLLKMAEEKKYKLNLLLPVDKCSSSDWVLHRAKNIQQALLSCSEACYLKGGRLDLSKRAAVGGVCVAQWVGCPPLDIGSGPYLRVMGSNPASGLTQSPYPSPCVPPHSLSLLCLK